LRELLAASPSETVLFQDWTPDGRALLFTRLERSSEQRSLWLVSIEGGEPRPLGLSMVGLRAVNMHPDGTKLTFTAGWPKKELWVIENALLSGVSYP
jgi:Tol biopolymer transport system component